VLSSGAYSVQCCKIPIKSNIKIPFWEANLQNYIDKAIIQFFKFGWPVNYCKPTDPISSYKNQSTAEEFPDVINEYIKTELKYGALAGPFQIDPFSKGLITSPLHTVSKKKLFLAKRRVVLDLSFPANCAVNDGIPRDAYMDEDIHLEYPGVDRFCELLIEKNVNDNGPWMQKRDLHRAYRQLKVDPHDFTLVIRFSGEK